MIRFFNTLSRKLDSFEPLDPPEARLYTCGPTVYDYAHIGNFRTFVFEDLLRRFLEFRGFKVKHVMNITDVDDKTIAGSNQNVGAPLVGAPTGQAPGLPLQRLNQFTAQYIEAFQEDLKTLNILPPTLQPRATEEIPVMLELIEKLIKSGTAYASDGSVYYRVSSFPRYGNLSKKNLEKNIKGVRVDVDEYDKEEGADFVLWKKAKEGEPSWDSPWGKGRPGWHIECSAMSMKYLGETFDIHVGGEDLIFPHHENEIAQSEASTGKKFVNYWLHSKHLLVNGEKMSKSKGNFYTLRDLLAKGYDPMAIRYALLSTHYRAPLNFTLEGLKEAGEVIKRLDECYFKCLSVKTFLPFSKQPVNEDLPKYLEEYWKSAVRFLSDDLNISNVMDFIHRSILEINTALADWIHAEHLNAVLDFFYKVDQVLGLKLCEIDGIPSEIESILKKYIEVRKIRDFSKSDVLRKEIEKLGWLVNDGRPGEPSTVKKKRRTWDFEKT